MAVPSIVATSASTTFSGDFSAAKAFDGLGGTRWAATTTTGWLRCQLASAYALNVYGVQASDASGEGNRSPQSWTFEGSNDDGSSWTTLDTRSGETGWGQAEARFYPFTNSTAYTHYRLNISANNGGSLVVVTELVLAGAGDVAATATENLDPSYTAKQGVDGNVSTLWAGTGTATDGFYFVAPSAAAYTQLSMSPHAGGLSQTPSGWTLAGSADGKTWTTLDTRSGVSWPSSSAQTFTFSNSTAYRFFRLSSLVSASSAIAFGEVSVGGAATSTTGTIAATAPAATSAAAGVVTQTGAISATAPAATVSAAGAVTVTGSIAATAPSAVAAAAGVSDSTATGAIAATAPAAVVSVAGAVTSTGIIAATAPAAVAALAGDVTTDGPAGSIAATAPAAVAAVSATADSPPISGVRVPTPDGILVVVPLVPATPPASLDLVTFERRSHVMAVLSAEHPDHDPHGNCEHGDNTVIVEDVGTPQLWIGGRNVTFWRDKLTDVVRWESEVPFGDTAAAFEFPQMNPWDKPGEGDLDWLYPDAPVHVGIVDDEGGVRRVWSGFYDANGIGLAEDEDYPWEAKGTLWMAMHQVHEPRPLTEPVDIWVLVARTLNGVINRRWKRIPEEPIGITTLNRGARDSFLWEYVQELLSEAVTDDGRQWTISEVMPGVFRPVLKPASSVVHATVAVGTPGVDVDVRIDESTRVDGFYARAIGPDNGGWANVFYPGLQLLTPPPYPNDDASVIQIGDTDADTDSGDGVSAIERRLNELGRWGRVTVDGVWESSDAAVLHDAQSDLGILADGQPGPQTWNRLFNRSGEGISLDPLRLPLVVKDWVMPRLYDAAGVDIGPNPDHDPTRVPRIVPLDLGFGKTKRQGAKLCRALLAKYGEAGAAGTIRWELDPNETDRTRLSHLSNVEVLGHQGTDRVLQVSHKIVELDEGTATSPRQYVVTTRVDEHARDAVAVEDILEQRRSAIPDLSRRPGSLNRASRQVNDQRIPWDSESPCGYVRRTAINGAAGLPSVIPIPFAEVGKVAGIELTATQPFAFALFASLRITENRAQAIVGNPFASANPFRPHYDALEPYGIIEAWGQEGDRCGYSPETQSEGGDFTGRFILNTPVDYWTETVPYVAMVVWFDGASGFISGRFIPAYEG